MCPPPPSASRSSLASLLNIARHPLSTPRSSHEESTPASFCFDSLLRRACSGSPLRNRSRGSSFTVAYKGGLYPLRIVKTTTSTTPPTSQLVAFLGPREQTRTADSANGANGKWQNHPKNGPKSFIAWNWGRKEQRRAPRTTPECDARQTPHNTTGRESSSSKVSGFSFSLL